MQQTMKLSAILALAGLSMFGVANAATISTTMNVSATISGTCTTITNTALTFSPAYAGTQLDGQGNIAVNCTNGEPYSLDVNNGNNFSSPNRRMKNDNVGTSFLNYAIYSDSGRATAWPASQNLVGSGSVQSYPVYGRIPAGQSTAVAGPYSDQLAVTVTY